MFFPIGYLCKRDAAFQTQEAVERFDASRKEYREAIGLCDDKGSKAKKTSKEDAAEALERCRAAGREALNVIEAAMKEVNEVSAILSSESRGVFTFVFLRGARRCSHVCARTGLRSGRCGSRRRPRGARTGRRARLCGT